MAQEYITLLTQRAVWWFYSRGTLGLAHGSRIAGQVVAAYGNDLGHLAEDAFDLRAGLVRASPWPRLLIRSEAPEQSIAYGALAEAASEAGLDPQDVFVNIRRGSILEDIFVFVSANPAVSVDLVTRLQYLVIGRRCGSHDLSGVPPPPLPLPTLP